jgi:lipopolysaccharide heptosyltransferase II
MSGAQRPVRWPQVKRILAIRLDAMGDLVMTTPALAALRRSQPEATVTLLTSPEGAEAAALVPTVDRVIAYRAPWMKHPLDGIPLAVEPAGAPGTEASPDDLALVERLRAERFDAAIVFTVHSQSPLPAALVAYLAGIPRRLAYCRENPYQLLTDWVPEPEPDEPLQHEVERQLGLVESVGCVADARHLSIRVPPAASRSIRARLANLGLLGGRRWLVVHAGASAPSRRYPAERYAELCWRLTADCGATVLLTGSAGEAEEVALIAADARAGINLAGHLDLGELAALLAAAPLLVANNSGPMHLAAAVGTPVVCLYAQTNLQHTPWLVPSRVLFEPVPCAGCRKSVCPLGHHRCLQRVTVEAVLQAVRELHPALGGLPAGAAASRWPGTLATSARLGAPSSSAAPR